MNLKEVKEKKSSLSFFMSYIDISKISVLKKLNLENKKLENIRFLKTANILLINKINEKWNYTISYQNALKNNDSKSALYFLVDPQVIDKITSNMLKKLKELIANQVGPNDYVITFGRNVNLIAQELELNIIENYSFDTYENDEEFSELSSSLIDIGIKNNIFNEAHLLLSEVDLVNQTILKEKLFPFDKITISKEEETQYLEVAKIEETNSMKYVKIFNELNLDKAIWEPNIDFFIEHFARSTVKQTIQEMKVRARIEKLKIELQLLEEKKNKLNEEFDNLQKMWNRIRKEESTIQSLLLYSAFKLIEEEEMVPLMKIDEKGNKV
ncbi:MAG: MMOB1630 family gliding motility ATPase complex subunit [Metamycoplasmataceae bacterium]